MHNEKAHTDDLNGMEVEFGTDCVHELRSCLGGTRWNLERLLIGERCPPLAILLS